MGNWLNFYLENLKIHTHIKEQEKTTHIGGYSFSV